VAAFEAAFFDFIKSLTLMYFLDGLLVFVAKLLFAALSSFFSNYSSLEWLIGLYLWASKSCEYSILPLDRTLLGLEMILFIYEPPYATSLAVLAGPFLLMRLLRFPWFNF